MLHAEKFVNQEALHNKIVLFFLTQHQQLNGYNVIYVYAYISFAQKQATVASATKMCK